MNHKVIKSSTDHPIWSPDATNSNKLNFPQTKSNERWPKEGKKCVGELPTKNIPQKSHTLSPFHRKLAILPSWGGRKLKNPATQNSLFSHHNWRWTHYENDLKYFKLSGKYMFTGKKEGEEKEEEEERKKKIVQARNLWLWLEGALGRFLWRGRRGWSWGGAGRSLRLFRHWRDLELQIYSWIESLSCLRVLFSEFLSHLFHFFPLLSEKFHSVSATWFVPDGPVRERHVINDRKLNVFGETKIGWESFINS